MNATNFKTGLVGFFDILGFSQIAAVEDQNEFGRIAELVKTNLVELPQIQKEIDLRLRGPGSYPITNGCAFADSILLWCELPKDFEVHYWYSFFNVCAEIMRRHFNAGLPLRGAISVGKFFVEDRCFFGKPIIEAHECAENTEWAGCCLSPKAQEQLSKAAQSLGYDKIMEQVCLWYPLPLKEHRASDPHTLAPQLPNAIKWSYYNLWHPDESDGPQIPSTVRSVFGAHGKTLSPRVELKIQNTIAFLQHVDGLYANANTPRRPHQPE
ncbi:MAG: hypothetical protein JWM68_4112 [Verrucomicrobiales bacterium]|nr:hypothetical protein [Verrucomicrobiales bacterium]